VGDVGRDDDRPEVPRSAQGSAVAPAMLVFPTPPLPEYSRIRVKGLLLSVVRGSVGSSHVPRRPVVGFCPVARHHASTSPSARLSFGTVATYRLIDPGDLDAPVVVAAFDGWIDAGGASTTAAAMLAEHGNVVATFERDALFDYRARRPTLEIVDGRLAELTWPDLVLRRARIGGQDLLVLAGPEPDYRWQELAGALVELVARLAVSQWISIGAIPAAVPHTRPVPILGTASRPGLLHGDVQQGPQGILRVPAAALSVLELAVSASGVPTVGYYAQVPHYVSGPYPAAAVELLHSLGRHLGLQLPLGTLPDEAEQLRDRLNAAAAVDDTTRSYVERLESMVDEARLPAGDELISDIERFLRERGGGGSRLN